MENGSEIYGCGLPADTSITDGNWLNTLTKLADLADDIAEAVAQTETKPTQAQQEAGNYRKGKVAWKGLKISIENPKGSTRSGVDPSGKAWSVTMKQHYGYILGSEGKDGDHVDIFIGPEPESEIVFVINQLDPGSGRFDEHKILAGFVSEADAVEAYLSNYEKGWKGLGEVCPLTIDQFKWWLERADTTTTLARDGWAKVTRKAAETVLRDFEPQVDFLVKNSY
jgi:hypothetical protein